VATWVGPELVFAGERDCRVEQLSIDEASLQPGELLVEVEVSVVSAGTEVANFTGLDPRVRIPGSWNAYPHRPGYGAVGRVVAQGPALSHQSPLPPLASYSTGQRVLAVCPHARYAVVRPSERPVVPLLASDDPTTMVLARMASVSLTALRKVSSAELGATAVVLGLGLVGNFAAQLFGLAGLEVLALDRDEDRVAMATGVGVRAVQAGAGQEQATVCTHFPVGADIVVEASGNPDAVPVAVNLGRDGSEVVLLGSPRGHFGADATAMLSEVHHRGIRLIGALEWLLPLTPGGPWQARWSLYQDYAILLGLLRQGRLKTNRFVSHVARASEAQQIYSRLALREPGMRAVLFDWR
jgi:2-desacetyl-2-hydroxyethyl bacteriochlorophyllide A dehydrogenase